MSRTLITKGYMPDDIDAALIKLDDKLRDVIDEGKSSFWR
jgi:hypothetical protein